MPEGAGQQQNTDTKLLETDDPDSRPDRETLTKMVMEMAGVVGQWLKSAGVADTSKQRPNPDN